MRTIFSCIDGDLLTTGKFIYSKKEKLNFIKAEEYCTNLGLQLPMPASVAENKEAGFQNQFYDWLSSSRYEILIKINEILMKKGMFLTFWLRTKNTYFNVKSKFTENPVFKREIKTEFVQDKDELISGRFSHQHILCSKCTAYIDMAIGKLYLANQFGWFKAQNYQVHGVVCETSIIAQPSFEACEIQRKF